MIGNMPILYYVMHFNCGNWGTFPPNTNVCQQNVPKEEHTPLNGANSDVSIEVPSKYTHQCWQCPQIGWQYRIKNKAAVDVDTMYIKEQTNNVSCYNQINNWTNVRVERIRARQLRARFTATLLSNLITQFVFNSCSFNYKSDYSSHIWGDVQMSLPKPQSISACHIVSQCLNID